jgi:hypothetical protein
LATQKPQSQRDQSRFEGGYTRKRKPDFPSLLLLPFFAVGPIFKIEFEQGNTQMSRPKEIDEYGRTIPNPTDRKGRMIRNYWQKQ